jgi:hypothetical protein
LIALKFLQGFREAVFFGGVIEWLLGDEDFWSVEQEYQLKKGHNFWSDRWITLKFLQGFREAVFPR